MTIRRFILLPALLLLAFSSGTSAQSAPPSPTTARVSWSGYVQPQYEMRTADGQTRDRALFRRMFVTLDVAGAGNWLGQFQADAGSLASGGDRLIIKNAFVQYNGRTARGVTFTIGNQKLPFSRSVLGSSSKRGPIERPFTGERAFGSPGRALSIKADGWHQGRTVAWSGALATVRQSPDADEVRLDGTAEAEQGWNEGPMLAGRVEWHPLGEVPRDHGDFRRGPARFMVGGAAYRWWNDDDVAGHGAGTVDVARVSALQLSGGFRGHGATVEAEFEHIAADAVDAAVTLGLYRDGNATLHKSSVETGYMLVPSRLEAVAAADRLATDSFERPWRRLSGGVVLYLNEHKLKFSLTHRESFDERGIDGARTRATYLQTQFAF